MQFLARVIWFIHWIIRFGLVFGALVVIVRRTWDSSLVRLWCIVIGSAFLSQRAFSGDCPVTIMEVILRDEFALAESMNRSRALEAFVAWDVPYPSHTLFALATACVIFCAWATFRVAKGAKNL